MERGTRNHRGTVGKRGHGEKPTSQSFFLSSPCRERPRRGHETHHALAVALCPPGGDTFRRHAPPFSRARKFEVIYAVDNVGSSGHGLGRAVRIPARLLRPAPLPARRCCPRALDFRRLRLLVPCLPAGPSAICLVCRSSQDLAANGSTIDSIVPVASSPLGPSPQSPSPPELSFARALMVPR